MRTVQRCLLVLAMSTTCAAAMAEVIAGDAATQKPLVDTVSNLAWYGFQTQSAGEQAGYRMATTSEFRTLLLDAGYVPTPANGRDLYTLDASIKANVPGIDFYFNPAAAGSADFHHDYLGWVNAGPDTRLVSVSDHLIAGHATSTAEVRWLAALPGVSNDWTQFTSMSGGALDAPNFMMVRAVPEPSSYALMVLGLLGIGIVRASRKGV